METALTPEQKADIERNPTSPRSAGLRGGSQGTMSRLTEEQLDDIQRNKDVAAMSYLWIISVVVLYARRDSPFIRHHARQGMWLFLMSIPVWIIPRVGHLLEFFVLAGMIIGFLNAAQGRYHDMPLVGQLARGTLTLGDIWRKGVSFVRRGWGTLRRGISPARGDRARLGQSERSSPPVL